jgi:hypothetical protein
MSEEPRDESGDNFEFLTGLVLAIFAAILSINGLGGGKFGGDETIANIDKTEAYNWLQAKSIKKNLTDNQITTMETFLDLGLYPPDKVEPIKKSLESYKSKSARYDREMKIIKEGHTKYENEEWFPKLDDEKIKNATGGDEYQEKANGLNDAGDIFDYGELFLQLCLVLGAVSLVVKKESLKKTFFGGLVLMGLVGTVFTLMAFQAAWKYL